ncbi:hypothetical protein EBQ81_01020 [bacterium]|nr:hypothetical protein [bacterium]
MSLKRAVAGLRAKRQGDVFESYLKLAAQNQHVAYLKIPTGCEVRRMGPNIKTIMVKSPFDFIFAYKGQTLFFDCKSTDEDRFVRSRIDWDQVESMRTLHDQGCKTGLIVFYDAGNRLTSSAHFYPLETILALPKGDSLKPSEASYLGRIYPTLSIDLIGLFGKL